MLEKVMSYFSKMSAGLDCFSVAHVFPMITRFFFFFFFYKKDCLYLENEPENTRDLKNMLRKCPASDAHAEIFKNSDFS